MWLEYALLSSYRNVQYSPNVFQGSYGHKFPALKQLKLVTTGDHPIRNLSDGVFIVPSLATIYTDGRFDKSGIEDLALSFPNVIEVRLKYRYYRGDPSEIWSVGAFKF